MLQMTLFHDPAKAATISPDGIYRYVLRRGANPCSDDVVNFIMMNPSVADDVMDDPTIRRVVGYARSWGFGDLVVTNLFAIRATDPAELGFASDPIGPENDRFIVEAARLASHVVCAWGCYRNHVGKHLRGRAGEVIGMLRASGRRLHYLRMAKCGEPCHPLFLPSNLEAIPWEES